jgi:hypothetical protein
MCFGHAIRTWHKKKVRLEHIVLFQQPMSATKLVKMSHHNIKGYLHSQGKLQLEPEMYKLLQFRFVMQEWSQYSTNLKFGCIFYPH